MPASVGASISRNAACCLYALLFVAAFARPAVGQEDQIPLLSEDALHPTARWRYHPGDDPAWAAPGFDDSTWEPRTDVWFEPGDLPASGWTGIGWFRTRFAVDSTLWCRPLALALYMHGAADVYLDGRRIATYGKVATSASEEVSIRNIGPHSRLLFLAFGRPGPHVLAVRQSNFAAANAHKIGGAVAGLEAWMEDPADLTREIDEDLAGFVATQFFFTGIPLAFAILYLMLFVFHPKERKYLYFAVLSASVAAMTFVDLGGERLVDSERFRFYRQLLIVIGIAMVMTLLRFVYALCCDALPRRFWYLLAGSAGLAVWGWLAPFEAFVYHSFVGFLLILEVARTVAAAVWRKQPDAWLIGLGLLLFMAGASYDIALDLGWMAPFGTVTNGYYYGFVGLLVPMALYLARDVARGHALQAEHSRQRRELEAARALQLSMLPGAVPEHPAVALAAFMRTATEVGGDYYDFDVADDGTLTIAIGDATGHGLRAGTMVTATKSLFAFLAQEADLERALARSSAALRRMGLPQLYMALALARLRGNTLEMAGAGMPPALLYQAATRQVEKIPLKGLPLGGPGGFPYRRTSVTLAPGDAVAFMSDGFPELYGETAGLLGYERAVSVFEEVATRTPQEIVEHLRATCAAWTNGGPPNDDVTFVVLQMKEMAVPEFT